MDIKSLSVEEVSSLLARCKSSSGKDCHDGDILRVVYESFRARAKGLDPHPKTYTGVLEEVRTNKDGDLIFIIGMIPERNGEYRTFNPRKGWIISLTNLSMDP